MVMQAVVVVRCCGLTADLRRSSLQGLRILDHGCDIEIDDPDTPLSLWDSLEKEVTGGWLRAILVRQFPA